MKKILNVEVVGKMRSKRAKVKVETGYSDKNEVVFIVAAKKGQRLNRLELSDAVCDLFEELDVP